MPQIMYCFFGCFWFPPHICKGVAGSIEYPSVTIDQLVDHVGIRKDLLDKPCSKEHLKTIASILPNWHKYAEALRLPDSQIQDIRLDPLLDTGMKAQKVMKMWHQANSFKATYRLIIEVCLQQRDVALAKSICEMIKGWYQVFPKIMTYNYNTTAVYIHVLSMCYYMLYV